MRFSPRLSAILIGGLLLVLLTVSGAVLARQGDLERLNLLLYDLILPLQTPPMSDEIVVVAVDERSIMELGRWPWSRRRHAELLDVLTLMRTKAVGLDILFSEPQDASSDRFFAEAIARNGRTVLAVAPSKSNPESPISELMPLPSLALAAAALGHVGVELDSDGVSRKFYRYSGLGEPRWPGMVLAMTQVVAGQKPVPTEIPIRAQADARFGWVRRARGLIAYAGHDDPPTRYAYADVLAGRIASEALRDKYVLVGVTASGIADDISTPISPSHQRTPGVELMAQVLNTLLQNSTLRPASPSLQIALTSLLIVGGSLAVLLLPLYLGLVALLGGMLVALLTSAVLLTQHQIWFAPGAALLMLGLGWLLWSAWQFDIQARFTRRLLRRLDHQSRYHLVTGLPNQGMLIQRLRELGECSTPPALTGLLILNIGWHDSASIVIRRARTDSLLLPVVARLRESVGDQIFLSHLNGDDFGLVISGATEIGEIHRVANHVLERLNTPLHYEGNEFALIPHLGVSIWPSDTTDVPELLRNAYTAVFQARINAQTQPCFYSDEIGNKMQVRAELERALSHAMQNNEFKLFYQPVLAADGLKITGAEALLRWHNPQLGWIGPAEFIPVAEHTGMIHQIGEWVLETACQEVKQLEQEGLGPMRMAVNISPVQFASAESLVAKVEHLIKRFGMTPSDLQLEVTESTVMNDLESAVNAMYQLRSLGVGLAIDDFGTGYSSLSSLRSFPVDRLKIDRSFVAEIARGNPATRIITTILNMTRGLGLKVIAEGVETEEQTEFLRRNGCDELQGYYFSPAIPGEEFADLLRAELTSDR